MGQASPGTPSKLDLMQNRISGELPLYHSYTFAYVRELLFRVSCTAGGQFEVYILDDPHNSFVSQLILTHKVTLSGAKVLPKKEFSSASKMSRDLAL